MQSWRIHPLAAVALVLGGLWAFAAYPRALLGIAVYTGPILVAGCAPAAFLKAVLSRRRFAGMRFRPGRTIAGVALLEYVLIALLIISVFSLIRGRARLEGSVALLTYLVLGTAANVFLGWREDERLHDVILRPIRLFHAALLPPIAPGLMVLFGLAFVWR